MDPLAHNPSIKLLLIKFNPSRTVVNPYASSVARIDSYWLPSGIVGIGWSGHCAERVCVDIELKLGTVEESGGANARDEDGICQARAGVVSFYCEAVSRVTGYGEARLTRPSVVSCEPVCDYHMDVEFLGVVLGAGSVDRDLSCSFLGRGSSGQGDHCGCREGNVAD